MKIRNIRIAVFLSALATLALTTGASAFSVANDVVITLGMRW